MTNKYKSQYLFIIYGAITVVWSMFAFFLLPDCPLTARFLNPRDRPEIIARLKANHAGVENVKLQWSQAVETLKDYRIWLLFLYQIANNIPNGGLSLVCLLLYIFDIRMLLQLANYLPSFQFAQIVMAGFGFNTLQVNLLTIPIGFVHGFFMIGRYVTII